jgi:hypothetical protein
MARGVIVELAKNPLVSAKVRLDAATRLMDRAGFVAPRATIERSQVDPSLHEMSIGELRALAAKLEDEMAGRAKDVSDTSTGTVEDVGPNCLADRRPLSQ